MPALTNQLVVKLRRLAVPTSLVAVAVVGSALYFHQSNVHAAGVTAAPLDDNSVSCDYFASITPWSRLRHT